MFNIKSCSIFFTVFNNKNNSGDYNDKDNDDNDNNEKWLFIHCFQIELKFGLLVFEEGGKPENPEKNSCIKDENQQQIQPIYGTRLKSNTGRIGGRRTLSPLYHPRTL